jgi:SAM-dependent methyltransferase
MLVVFVMPFEPRFGPAAEAYKAFRPDYPPELFAKILAVVRPGCGRRAVDLGAGTGRSTRALLEHFAEIIAVEPDPLMADKIRETAPRAVVRIARAEEFEQEPATVDLVNIAAALHWMDADRIMAKVESWLRPGGILAISGGRFPKTPKPVRQIVREEFNLHWNSFRDPRLNATNTSEGARSHLRGLHPVDDSLIPHPIPLSPEQFAGFCRSTSYGSAYARTLPDPEGYWRSLQNRFRGAWPEEKFPVDFSVWLLLAKKD